jgi:NAD(P)H-dependent FMN reductase
MLPKNKIVMLVPIIVLGCVSAMFCARDTSSESSSSMTSNAPIGIILGSTRLGRTSDKIGKNLEKIANAKGVAVEIIDLRDYQLPFLQEEIIPARRTVILDPSVQKWSDKITSLPAFVIVSPEYNAGYPGVLKNALDSLYVEWNAKPVGLVGYSGGMSGGEPMLAQLDQVVRRLRMAPVNTSIKIPKCGKAFDAEDNFIDPTIAQNFGIMLDQLVAAIN